MSISDKYRPQFTYDDYREWEGRWELIDGMSYAVSPSPVRRHQEVSANLYSILKRSISDSCKHCKVYLALDWKIDEKTVVQPDLFVVCNAFETDFLEVSPSLIVEIISPSTAYKDRHEKFELYEEQGVSYYLIADTKFQKIEVYQLMEGRYQPMSVNPGQYEFHLENSCRLSVDFEETWQ